MKDSSSVGGYTNTFERGAGWLGVRMQAMTEVVDSRQLEKLPQRWRVADYNSCAT